MFDQFTPPTLSLPERLAPRLQISGMIFFLIQQFRDTAGHHDGWSSPTRILWAIGITLILAGIPVALAGQKQRKRRESASL